ncbi:Arogenate dehydrogenase [Anaerohalosphaera lusitana]|uniref:Arogenate dehydrogenase n=1 Tax=Anaerohalosphaera lusitana TaxID=1936003 RepID=A0A1U9NNC1_9BACT|nr:prephenate dehydrogenase [Anaerohalosphaera lusitana]AQT69016.1 Arogenate dehydrogenase [Anaerohalosphaera lusitana]
MKNLQQITVIGMGLLGGSVTLSILRSLNGVKAVGYSHRESTRNRARELCIASEIADDMNEAVKGADIVILATPIYTFERIFKEIASSIKPGAIITDVGSTKVLPHRWGEKIFSKDVAYVGSHPIAGSEKSGVDYARDDLLVGAKCIVTRKKKTNEEAVKTLVQFWAALGSRVSVMSPAEHDRIFGSVSHLPHVVAVALVNASNFEQLKYAGKGFIDTSRIASGPSNVWSDILLSNTSNTARGIDRMIKQLSTIKEAIEKDDQRKLANLLEKARTKRAELIDYKISKKELL